jgi:hypothetical protein
MSMTRRIRAAGKGLAAVALAAALAVMSGPSAARQAENPGAATRQTDPVRLAQGRPSASVIESARRSGGLPADARAVGWRLVEGGQIWKIIFRVGNRQVAVKVPAGG